MDGVLFDLRMPLSSWSEAGSQYRPTDAVPTWSALVGIVGASMGWGRGAKELVNFAREFAPAIQVKRTGNSLMDFQTIQSPSKNAFKRQAPRTRIQELNIDKDKVNTSITRREYIQDADYRIVLLRLAGFIDTGVVCNALQNPVYPLYAGRRSCPLGFLNASLVSGTLLACLPGVTHWDHRLDCDLEPSVVRERRDMLLRSVEPRRFGLRLEAVR